MRIAPRFLIALAALLMAGSFAAAADDAYAIKIIRPFKAGDAYDTHILIDGTDVITRTEQGNPRPPVQTSFAGDLTARVDIAGVDKTGSEKDFSLTIKKFTGPAGKVLVEAGKIIDVKRTDKEATFALHGGGDLSDDAKNILGQIYDRLNSTGITDEDVFGSRTPRKVGEKWPADAEQAAKQAAGSDTQVDPAKFAGETILKGVEKIGDVPVLRLETTIAVRGIRPPLPTGFAVDRSDFSGKMVSAIPVDPALPVLQSETTYDTDALILHVTSPLRIARKLHIHQVTTVTPIKK